MASTSARSRLGRALGEGKRGRTRRYTRRSSNRDPVKSLAVFPQVLTMMSEKID
jgi:hypothetical protein